jgi:hypothetical protein
MKRFLLAVLLAGAATAARAETYRVDLIVFLDKSGGSEAGRRVEAPNLAGAIDIDSPVALANAGITILPESQFALNDEWQHLRNAKRYQPLLKLAWTQKDPPAERGPSLRVHLGQAFAVSEALAATTASPVDGTIALLLEHYLHLDADLVYTLPVGGGGFVSYGLKEKRKMKRDELHHLDSAKLGILVKLGKVTPAK